MEGFIRAIAGFTFCLIVAAALAVTAWVVKLLLFRRKEGFSALALASALLGIALGLIGTLVVPAFENAFAPFGDNLPALTKLALNFRYLLWAPLLLIALSWWPLRAHKARARYYLACFLAQTLLLCLVFWALYAPIFNVSCIND